MKYSKGKTIYSAGIAVILMVLLLCLNACGSIVGFFESGPVSQDSVSSDVDYTQFYYNQLSSAEKRAYTTMLKGCERRKDKIVLRPVDSRSFYRAQGALMYDHPEFFWIRSFSISLLGENVVSVNYPYEDGFGTQYDQVERSAMEVVQKGSGKSDYDTVKYFYDYIIGSVEYDGSGEDAQDLRSVFLSRKSVCAGYAKAFQYLCTLAEIPCITMRGTTKEGESHAWNLIHINGKDYWVDVTWGDPVYTQDTELDNTNYNYFCVTDDELFQTHVISHNVEMDQMTVENAFVFPSCTDDSLNYYRLNGAYFDSYDRETVRDYLVSTMRNGKMTGVEMKFGSQEAYQNAMSDLFTGNRYIETILLDYRSFGVHSIAYTYGFMEDCNYLVLNIHYQ